MVLKKLMREGMQKQLASLWDSICSDIVKEKKSETSNKKPCLHLIKLLQESKCPGKAFDQQWISFFPTSHLISLQLVKLFTMQISVSRILFSNTRNNDNNYGISLLRKRDSSMVLSYSWHVLCISNDFNFCKCSFLRIH